MPDLFVLDMFSIIAAILFIAGFVLLAVEVAVPGFGAPGVSGIICLIAGIILVVSGKIALAGIVWAITVILSCIARRIEICRKKKSL